MDRLFWISLADPILDKSSSIRLRCCESLLFSNVEFGGAGDIGPPFSDFFRDFADPANLELTSFIEAHENVATSV